METEARLREAQKLESVGRLAAGIAHEINTPMQYVGDNTRFIQENFDGLLALARKCVDLISSAQHGELSPEALAEAEVLIRETDIEFLASEIPDAIAQSLEGIERVTKIVRAMKEFSHPARAEKSATDLNKTIETTITVARNEWKYVSDMAQSLTQDCHSCPVLSAS